MGGNHSKPEQTGKLDLYLNDVFQKECSYHMEEAEVVFMQTGVETLVNQIARKVKEDDTLQEAMKTEFEKYFKGKLFRSPADIFDAGSFYEGTKNSFPDEFDFILNLYNCKGTFEQYRRYLLEAAIFDTVNDTYAKTVKEILEQDKPALFYSSKNSASKLYFKKYLKMHGPATWLRFVYETETGEKREIDIDYVPALCISDKKILEQVVEEVCALPEFAKEVLSVGTCFCIGPNFSFTETEVHIMKNLLSEKHRKIYRILKFLINGNGDGENLKDILKYEKAYSSYMIKKMMIYHHFECKSSDQDNLGPCLLEILDNMCKYKNSSEYPSLFKTNYASTIICDLSLVRYLQRFADSLRSLQRQPSSSYDYKKDKLKKSVSKMYRDDKQKK